MVLVRAPLVFVLPAGHEAPSGGNVYDRELGKALAALTSIRIVHFAEASQAIDSKSPGLYLFDTLDLEKTLELPERSAGQAYGLVVHHLPSLEPGILLDDPALAMENRALGGFDFFVATSDFTRALLVGRGYGENAVFTVPPGLSAESGPPRVYEPPLSALLVANVIPRKGVLSLLEALAAHESARARYSLRIVGRTDMDPAYVEACRRTLVNSSSLGRRVRIDGPRPYEHMAEVYEAAHLLVSASAMETFGMAIHEARAHGLPVLAVNGGYVRNAFSDGENGVLCSSPEGLAKKLVELDEDEAAMRSLFGRAQASRPPSDYTWAAAAQRLLEEIERVSA